tara:strand:+ start:3224 stop:4177 length:954 start_codon:yes stop_codon:yes gene_type:complete
MRGETILILGGTGALGKTLTKRYHKENNIIIFSRDEHKQVEMKRLYPNLQYHIGNVKEKDSILQSINEYKPSIIINTAALKHVPICENNPYESVKTNIIGHKNLIDSVSLSNHQVKTLMFISTDKACSPINVYGMCKAISERLYIDFANKQKNIKVVLCRYGNVLESTGSVIPLFKSILKQGTDHLPITHPEMTRFLLSLEDAVNLIQWAYDHKNSHGKIVIPNIKALKVIDIAKALIKNFNSLQPQTLKNVGIRPGEKLHEAMISLEESIRTEKYDKYFMITDKILHNQPWVFDSSNSLMKPSETEEFLKNKGILR